MLGFLAIALIYSFHQMGYIQGKTQVYHGIECSILIVLAWLICGIMIIKQAQKSIQNWRKLEENACDSEYLKMKAQQYEKLYYTLSKNQDYDIPMDLIQEVEYLVMRIQFINPVYLPTLTESFLSKDFNFGKYLEHAHAKTITNFLNTHFFTLICGLPLMSLFFVAITASKSFIAFFGVNKPLIAAYLASAMQVFVCLAIVAVFSLIKQDFENIKSLIFPQIMLNIDPSQYDEIDE